MFGGCLEPRPELVHRHGAAWKCGNPALGGLSSVEELSRAQLVLFRARTLSWSGCGSSGDAKSASTLKAHWGVMVEPGKFPDLASGTYGIAVGAGSLGAVLLRMRLELNGVNRSVTL